jgi:hypothetical protein
MNQTAGSTSQAPLVKDGFQDLDLPPSRRDFLYKDFDAVFRYRIAFSNMRLVALGAAVTLFGALVSTKPTVLLAMVGQLLAIELVSFTGIRIIASLNRGIAVFANHLAWVEKQLGQRGFSTYWSRHLSIKSDDSGSHAFLVATRSLNIGTFVYVCAGLVPLLQGFLDLKYAYSIGIGAPAVLAGWNEFHIRRRLDPCGFVAELAQALDRARSESFPLVESSPSR